MEGSANFKFSMLEIMKWSRFPLRYLELRSDIDLTVHFFDISMDMTFVGSWANNRFDPFVSQIGNCEALTMLGLYGNGVSLREREDCWESRERDKWL